MIAQFFALIGIVSFVLVIVSVPIGAALRGAAPFPRASAAALLAWLVAWLAISISRPIEPTLAAAVFYLPSAALSVLINWLRYRRSARQASGNPAQTFE